MPFDWEMTEVLRFRVPTKPPHHTPQAQERITTTRGFAAKYKTGKYKRQEREVISCILDALPKGWEPLEGPVAVTLVYAEEYRKSEPKKRTASGRALPKYTTPDAGNWAKGIEDCMTRAGVWRDDNQIALEILAKAWVPRPYWEVRVARLGASWPAEGRGLFETTEEKR